MGIDLKTILDAGPVVIEPRAVIRHVDVDPIPCNPFSFLDQHARWFEWEKQVHFNRRSAEWMRVNRLHTGRTLRELMAAKWKEWRERNRRGIFRDDHPGSAYGGRA